MILFQYHPVYKNQPIVACKSFVLSNYQDNCNYTQHPCNVLFKYISFSSNSSIGHVHQHFVHFDQKKILFSLPFCKSKVWSIINGLWI